MIRSLPGMIPTRVATSRLIAGASLVLALGAAGCSTITDLGNCTDELRVKLSPADTTLAAGSSFTQAVSLSTCGGREALEDTFTYESTNVAVATVDPVSGRVTGVDSGEAHVVVTGRAYGVVGRARVTVLP